MSEALNFSGRRRLPVIIAAEAAECGLASVAMIGSFFGHDIDLNGLRQRFAFSMAGTTLQGLASIASELDLATRALRVDLGALSKVQVPAILHWDFNHFVVLKGVAGQTATIHDPLRGQRRLTMAELSDHFTGVVLELRPTSTFKPVKANTKIRLQSLWSTQHGFWGSAFQVLAISVALQVLTFAAPFQIQLVVDEAIAHADMSLLNVLALGFGAILVAQACLDALRNWSLQIFGNMLVFQMVGNVFRHLIRLPSEYFEKRHVGDILSRIESTSAIQDALTKGIVSSLVDGAMALLAMTILFLYSPTLAAVVVAAVSLNLIVALSFYGTMRARNEEQLVAGAKERTHIMESIRAAITIKLFGAETKRENSWRNLYANVINKGIIIGKLQITVALIQSIVVNISSILVIYLGARTVLSGSGMSIGMLMAFLSFRQTFSDRTLSLINQAVQFKLLGLHLERLSDIVATEPEAGIRLGRAVDVRGGLALRRVSFRYGATERWVLREFDLSVIPGEFLAITGASGGGKTTLVKLMLGLRKPEEGEVLLDGIPATAELWKAWREYVGVVAQDDQLISGSISENISFFDAEMDMARVQEAAEAAQVHADILKMPMQYLSLVGDMGSAMSGGQRQRVLLARALYRRPKILFLDEGTANLDEGNENAILDVLSALQITRVCVAHSQAFIDRADRSVVIA